MKTPAEWAEQLGIYCDDQGLEACEDRCAFGCYARERIIGDAVDEALECCALVAEAREHREFARDLRLLKHHVGLRNPAMPKESRAKLDLDETENAEARG